VWMMRGCAVKQHLFHRDALLVQAPELQRLCEWRVTSPFTSGAGVAASMNWKLASLQEAWNQHKRGGGHSEATAVEEPAAEATVEEPAAEATVEEPAAQAAVEEPAAQAAVEEPAAEAAVEEPAAEATVEEPAAEAAVEEPAAEAAVEEPAAVKEPRPMEAVDAVKVGQSPDPPCRQVPSEELQLAAIAQQLVQLPRSERISRLEVLVSSWKSQDDSFCLPKAVEVNVREEPAKKTKAVAEPAREKPPLKKRRNYYLQEVDLWRQRVLCAAQAAVPDSPLGIKAYQSMEELLRHFKTIRPECDWETVDNDWVEQEQVRFQLSAYLSAGVESVDYLAAQLLPGHVLNNGVLVLDTYKCVPTSTRHTETAMFDEGKGRWTLAKSAHAETTLADVVKQVYIDSTPEDWVGLPPKVAFQIALLRKVANTAMEKGLYDPYFFAELDGNKYRDFLLFLDGWALHVPTMQATRGRRDLRMSRSLGISYPGDLTHKLDVLNVAALLEEVACFEDGLPEKDYTSEDMFPQTLADRLWNLSQHPEFAALRFLFSSHESWPRVLFLLKFAAFQLFHEKLGGWDALGRRWEERQERLDVLTKPPQPPDEAAPVRFGLRGRRLLWFNELEEKHPIQSTIFKDFRDHATTLTARTLYGDNVDFNVTWGMVLATNSRVSWTAEDGGVGRSLTKVRWPLRFVAPGMPLGPNDRVVDLRWKATAVVDSVAPGLLYLLLQVYKVFLPRLTDTQIHPRPHCVVLETGDSSETFYASKAVANFVETTGTLPKSGPDCLGWQAALEAFTASARGINRVGARDIFKAEFEAHKYCGKLLAKHRETKAFLASSKR
ncbi:unnamed protein product, partial [Effrenium voratum]